MKAIKSQRLQKYIYIYTCNLIYAKQMFPIAICRHYSKGFQKCVASLKKKKSLLLNPLSEQFVSLIGISW